MDVYIYSSYKGQRVFKDFTSLWIKTFLNELKNEKKLKNKSFLKSEEITVFYVKPSVIKKLNKDYRGKNKVTDVLSFTGDGVISLGEIIVCQEELKRKSEQTTLNLRLYSQFMISHSLLHLLGYTHEDSVRSEKEMMTLQNKLLRRVASKLAPSRKNEFDISLQA